MRNSCILRVGNWWIRYFAENFMFTDDFRSAEVFFNPKEAIRAANRRGIEPEVVLVRWCPEHWEHVDARLEFV